jgi:hypothetical protein
MKRLPIKILLGSTVCKLTLCGLVLMLYACSGEPDSSIGASSNSGSIAFRIVFQRAPNDKNEHQGSSATGNVCVDYLIETIRAEVYNSSDNLITSDSWDCDTPGHTGTIDNVKAGNGIYLLVEGIVAGNADWQKQTDTFSVVARETTDVGKVILEYHGGNPDYDGDGYNSTASGGSDCDDFDDSINPGAMEYCDDGIDNDCDSATDCDDSDCDSTQECPCADKDGDSYYTPSGCGTEVDCNDNDDTIHPGATEVCDGIDNNCNGSIDENVPGGCLFVQGQLHHRGTPMSDITNVNPSFWIRNEETGQTYNDYTAHYDSTDGTYRIYHLPSYAGIQIAFHVTGVRATLPGNYRAWKTWDSSMPSQFDINVPLILHLVEPWDNSYITHWPIGEYPQHASPLHFDWDGMTGSVEYRIRIDRYRDPEHPSGYGYIDTILNQNISYTSFINSLNSSASFEHYEFKLLAYENNVLIGYYTTSYSNGLGWDYRFKIAPAVTLSSGQGYDFSVGTAGGVTHGDFYFLYQNNEIRFWANNSGMNGLQDVGSYYVNLNDVPIPTTGYNRFGVPVVAGHAYVSLAQDGEEGQYIIFNVVSATTSQVTLYYLYGPP